MSDLYKLGQSQQGSLEKVGKEIRLDVQLSDDPFLNTGSVSGTITNPNGNPVEGVLIKILNTNLDPLYHVLTDENGYYAINAISPGSEYHLVITKDGYLINEVTVFSIVSGQMLDLDATITPDPNATLSTITAHIYDTENNPLEGVIATLLKIVAGEEIIVAVTTTNEYGQCAFINVELGTYLGRGTKQGYMPITSEIQVTQPGSIIDLSGNMQISPTESQGTINGTITDDEGNGIVDAVVILYEVSGDPENPTLTPRRYTRTIAGGAYLFGDVPQGNYIVKANKES
ncbi:carboxypeptidase-like regulatory domain-containing protein [Tepidibacter hydrothermalis]|uniref:Carboxypeptidase-like regulatory domain-containing protein n=1 Tax=Tepidibacter hydrothermalis TaxID=3036126 RepID=A0ABY8ED96_9FIRM|nr:carboxypeptidase-like regulatory domain-containing protein [Tepidibacter hydrothermalis]WFD10892.1 carboxypeptidase-like regulatory domain-containing protein [Tepidibacter hydrothermalis]